MLKLEVETLNDVFTRNPAMMETLRAIDSGTADNLDATLKQAMAILSKKTVSESDRVRLPLILSAIGHQLEEFERARVHPN